MKLYYSPGACSLAPHIIARELDVPVELKAVRIAEGENTREEFLRLNPRGRVPVLEVDGQVYTEAPAIMTYLASLSPDSGLIPPAGSAGLIRMFELMAWVSSSLHIAYAQLWRPQRFVPAGSDAATVLVEQGPSRVEELSADLDRRIAGPWMVGEDFSLADAYSLPFFRWGNRIGIPMRDRCPRWAAHVDRMLARPSVVAAIEFEGFGFDQF